MLKFDRIIGIDWSGADTDWGLAEWSGSDISRPKLPESLRLPDESIVESLKRLRDCSLPRVKTRTKNGVGSERKDFRKAVDADTHLITDRRWQELLENGLAHKVLFGIDKVYGVKIPENLRESYMPLVRHAQFQTQTWRLPDVVSYLCNALNDQTSKRTLVMVDAAIGYPSGFVKAVFGGEGWSSLVDNLGRRFADLTSGKRTIDVARELNEKLTSQGQTPVFAMTDNWPSVLFYTRNNVSPFRLVDQILVSAKSPLDFQQRTKGKVAGHAISCLSAIANLQANPKTSFTVWPQETHDPNVLSASQQHVMAEVYPTIFDSNDENWPDGMSSHDRDAAKAVKWAVEAQANMTLADAFDLNRFGFDQKGLQRVQEEGWILGLDK